LLPNIWGLALVHPYPFGIRRTSKLLKINNILITGKDIVHNFINYYKMHFHYVLSMGAVFAMFAG
jgi:hypothetical protein